ncbi:Uncharacterised protein [Candidatus Anstonella stagnisolia]|nr:Uncharacterised protein [Candidatus Anstonella stagnisolia]
MTLSYRPLAKGLVLMERPLGMKVITSAGGARAFRNTHEIKPFRIAGLTEDILLLVPAPQNTHLPGTTVPSPHLEKIAYVLEKKDFMFVHNMLSQILANTGSQRACESAAMHISSSKDSEAMLLAAASLATLSTVATNEQAFLFYLKKAPRMDDIGGNGMWIELGNLMQNPQRYFSDSVLSAAVSKAVELLCNQYALHTAQRLPMYASLLLLATQNPAATAQNVELITNVLLEHLHENPDATKSAAHVPANPESSASTPLWL